ncbi:hypothetical protein SDRG_11716 [Saprolegnia diclina VS20]|uniref:ABC transporter domain-containing protein n=1 Tax=Saprolegnia diclina (strain VS20) TaxID=1156394 RepID=T0Q7Q2_SAPDV|nr:hypothetical protein SDRG_11716 [Saprolegnia diclina VS20]EQC30661.1 hypothetical protein SDRG_11716 [Saprolegnia diclina VS20]|eukprot:XP_008615987.1 hypothetical protein SDRG_11716 [Saprolegnia diclina VS20]
MTASSRSLLSLAHAVASHHDDRDGGWATDNDVVSPGRATFLFDSFCQSHGITQDVILSSQRNQDPTSTQQIISTVFTKENIQALGFRNLIKQIRAKLCQTSQVPTAEIRLRGVSYTAKVKPSDSSVQTLASSFSPPSLSCTTIQTRVILNNIDAHLKPGSMTLILGPPGCGKTSLLKLIAGLTKPGSNEALTGTITYNGCTPDQVDLASLTTYVQQQDHHYPMLTVKETLDFAHKCLVGTVDVDDPLAANEEHMVDILISVFGLTECADTPLGDDMIRGVSGGQKRRVTVAEMLTGRAPTLLIDEFSNGLDASTTFDIARAIRTMAELLEKTVVMSMLQPPPEVYDLFDDIIVLDKGEMIYNGPRTELPAYFESLGYVCPARKDIADFLQEVTTPLGVRFATTSCPVASRPTQRSQFAARFRESTAHAALRRQLAATNKLEWTFSSKPVTQHSRLSYGRSFGVVFGRTLKASIDPRQEALVMGSIIGTVFLDIGRKATTASEEAALVPIKMSLFFLALLFQALATLTSIESGISRRHVLYKQSAFHFFPISTYAISEALLEWLWTLPQALAFCSPLYFGVGLHGNFGVFVGLVYLTSLVYTQFFKLWTAISPDAVLAKVLSMFAMCLHMVSSGYIMPGPSISAGWQWLYWCNPMAWALRAAVQNEFLTSTPLYDTPVQKVGRVGNLALDAFGFSINDDYIWSSVLFLLGFYVVELALTTVLYTYVRIRPAHAGHTDDAMSNSVAARSLSFDLSEMALATPTTPDATFIAVLDASDESGLNSLAFSPVTLAFRDLSYTIQVGAKKQKSSRQLLQGIHGCFEPGTLTALMGSTGAGKTTLMDVIAGRKTAGVIAGDLYVNGHPMDRTTFNILMGYCEQFDIYEETSTVVEAFLFCAALRLPSSTSAGERAGFVRDVLVVLELQARANAQLFALSLGERKRVTIGVELLSNPSILFLDEPTTGLDSRAATIVMECVKRIAQSAL